MRKTLLTILLCSCAFIIVNNPLSTEYVASLKGDAIPVAAQKDKLYKEIEEKAHEYNMPPEDAKIDRVWKAMPGINGLQVNIEASYKKMKEANEFDEKKLVFDQIKPKVQLDQLPPSPIYKGHPEKQQVSFLINVAWGNEYLPDMLETLKSHHVSATFFLEGRWVQNNPDLAKMIADAGHEVGNHSYTHPKMEQLSAQKTREEIKRTTEVIKATTEEQVKWFAPPSGGYRDETVKIAAEEKLGTVMWTVDTIDWQKPPADVLIQRVLSKIDNGSMVLMHPTASTAQAMDNLIKGIEAKGLEIVSVSELLSSERKPPNFLVKK